MLRFLMPTEIITGVGCAKSLGEQAARFGTKALVVCGKSATTADGWLDAATTALQTAGLDVTVFTGVSGEPSLDVVDAGIAQARANGCDVIVGLGGGSAMDTAKAIAGLCNQPLATERYHNGEALSAPALPLITLPTTSGTGAEVTKNAVLINVRTGLKQSIRDDDWFPNVALVDPELTLSMPAQVTASSGADALCQAIEAYTSIAASEITDGLAMRAISLIGSSLERAYQTPDDLDAREAMSMGSLMAGMAMASARLGGVHGMAHPLGSHFHMPHGVVCGLLLAPTMRYNVDYATEKYATVGRLMGVEIAGLSERDAAIAAIERIGVLMDAIGIPSSLKPFGVDKDNLDTIIEQSLPSGSLKHNPRPLQAEDVRAILESVL